MFKTLQRNHSPAASWFNLSFKHFMTSFLWSRRVWTVEHCGRLLNSHREQRYFPGLVSFVAIKPEKVYACSWRLNHFEVISPSKSES